MNIHTIILAVGKGTRMNTNLPKVMQPLGGQTLVSHVIKTAKSCSKDITVIVGHHKDLLKEHIADIDPNIQTADQNEQLGTAHAVKTASHLIKDDEKVLVLYGDVPLIRGETIEALINSGQNCTLLSMKLDDPTGYGRIMTNEENLALKIIEQKDASDVEKQIKNVFTGILLIDGSILKPALNEISNQNAANEFYLTDLVEILSAKGVKINCIQANPTEVMGANNKHELHELESILRKMSAEKLLEQGITLLDAARVDVREHQRELHLKE